MTVNKAREQLESTLLKIMNGEELHLHFYNEIKMYGLRFSRCGNGESCQDDYIIDIIRRYRDWYKENRNISENN